MCKEHIIARQTVLNYIKTKTEFTLDELKKEILHKDGIMRVSMGVTVSDFLEEFDRNGILKFKVHRNGIKYLVNPEVNHLHSNKAEKVPAF